VEVICALEQAAAPFSVQANPLKLGDERSELVKIFCNTVDGQMLQWFPKTNRLWIVSPVLEQLEAIVGQDMGSGAICAPSLVRQCLLAFFCEQQQS